MPLQTPYYTKGITQAIPVMERIVSQIVPPGAEEQPQKDYVPPTHQEIQDRVSRIYQPSRRGFLVRPFESGTPEKGRFGGVPDRGSFIQEPAYSPAPQKRGRFGNGTTIWGAKGAAVTQAEVNVIEGRMNGLNYFAAAVGGAAAFQAEILDGAVKFALKHIAFSQGKPSYTPDTGLPLTKRTEPVYLSKDLWLAKVQSAIGVVRYMMDDTNWGHYQNIITVEHPKDWWDRYATAIYNYLYTYGWLPPKWW